MGELADDVKYLGLDTDYLGFLNSQLRNLKGYHILANELIQNAHDAKGANKIVFDVCDDALIVENNGLFSDCGQSDQPLCPWKFEESISHMCDLHRFRQTASGDKRREENAAGAFGIGFISVYQITDHPEIFTDIHHWRLDPSQHSDRRILARTNSPSYPGTRFRLPWATQMTTLRKVLGAEPVPNDVQQKFIEILIRHLPQAAIFVDKLETYEIRQNGNLIKTVGRKYLHESTRVEITEDGVPSIWQILTGSFDEKAQQIRQKAKGVIEDKRNSSIALAFSSKLEVNGLFYALVPTEHSMGLPFHLNADFFPNSDRKTILLDDEYQGHWNQAAIDAAAELVTRHLEVVRDILGPVKLWAMVREIKALATTTTSDKTKKSLAKFWEESLPVLKDAAVVYSTRGEWHRPTEKKVVQLLSADEKLCVPALEQLSLRVTHLDLNPFLPELREIGVKVLDALTLLKAIKEAGFNKKVPVADIPEYVLGTNFLSQISAEIDLLIGRVKNQKNIYPLALEELEGCSIAPSVDGWLCPVGTIRTSDLEGQNLFAFLELEGMFVARDCPSELLSYIEEFNSSDVVELLRSMDKDCLQVLWLENADKYISILHWLADRRLDLDSGHVSRLAELPIWPAGSQLRPLGSLVFPGDFEDPLGLTEVIDARVQACCRELLTHTLKVSPLKLENYVEQYLPHALATCAMSDDIHQRLLQFLAKEIGRIIGSKEAVNALANAPIARCRDGQFLKPRKCYFQTTLVKEILGYDASIVVLPDSHSQAVEQVYRCLGVQDQPRPLDVIARIKQLVKNFSDSETRTLVRSIFSALGTHWSFFSDRSEEFEDLCSISWLPAENDIEKWYSSGSVYNSFQKSQFSSQAKFLDIDLGIQRKSTDFMNYLGILGKPTTQQIVRHLMHCSENGYAIKNDVYMGLNDDADNLATQSLRGKKCIHLGDGYYVAPHMVFWEEHPFGEYRYKLNDEWRQFYKFLKAVGVERPPSMDDAISVLGEVSRKTGNNPLGEEDKSVVHSCWKLLQSFCDEDRDASAKLEILGERKVVLNLQGVLTAPKYIFFEDRPQLLGHFDPVVSNYVISRPESIWKAMSLSGVRPLSQAVEADAIIKDNPLENFSLVTSIKERLEQIARVLESSGITEWRQGVLDDLEVLRVERLQVRYHLRIFGQSIFSEDCAMQAFYSRDENSLFLCYEDALPWTALARELVYALCPGVEAGQMAPGIKEILCAETLEAAEKSLNELGYAPFQRNRTKPVKPATAGLVGEGIEDPPPEGNPGDDTDPPKGNIEGQKKQGPTGMGEPKDPSPTGDREEEDFEFRFLSYASRRNSDKQGTGEDKTTPINKAGIAHVLAYEAKNGRRGEEQTHSNPGFDIMSFDAETGELVRYIEVKSLGGNWDRKRPVGISSTQYEFGRSRLQNQFWLYIVERAESDDASVIVIKDPVSKITDYLFDYGWKQIAGESKEEGIIGLEKEAAASVQKPRVRSILDLQDTIKPTEATDYDQP